LYQVRVGHPGQRRAGPFLPAGQVHRDHPPAIARDEGVPPGAFGPHLTALVALLHGRYRLSARECAALLGEVFGVPLALGTIPALCQQVSAALAAPYAEAATYVQGQAVANIRHYRH